MSAQHRAPVWPPEDGLTPERADAYRREARRLRLEAIHAAAFALLAATRRLARRAAKPAGVAGRFHSGSAAGTKQ